MLWIHQTTTLTITTNDLTSYDDFDDIIDMITAETDSQGNYFLDWDSSLQFYSDLVTDYPYIVSELYETGTTYLGETIYALHMTYTYTSEVDSLGLSDTTEYKTDLQKPSIIIVGGHYGNSMLAHTYIFTLISKLIHGFHQNDGDIVNLLKLRHIWFVPFLNIDTYKYIQSYTGDLSDLNTLVKNRKSIEACSDLQTGVNLANNYDYKWGTDNFGSTDSECMEHYRGTEAFSESEIVGLVDLYNYVNSPSLVLSIESSDNFIKYPNNYINDATNIALTSSTSEWFYTAIIRDTSDYGLTVSSGNYVSLKRVTNNGDNDDYFLSTLSTMAFTWNIGTTVLSSLSDTSSLLQYGLYVIQKSGEQISATVTTFEVCIPTTQQ